MLIDAIKVYHSTQEVNNVHFMADHYRCKGKWGNGCILMELGQSHEMPTHPLAGQESALVLEVARA